MTDKPENPQAFPAWEFESYGGGAGRHVLTGGMTLRDYFAGQALAGVSEAISFDDADELAHYCYTMADAMLKERAK